MNCVFSLIHIFCQNGLCVCRTVGAKLLRVGLKQYVGLNLNLPFLLAAKETYFQNIYLLALIDLTNLYFTDGYIVSSLIRVTVCTLLILLVDDTSYSMEYNFSKLHLLSITFLANVVRCKLSVLFIAFSKARLK